SSTSAPSASPATTIPRPPTSSTTWTPAPSNCAGWITTFPPPRKKSSPPGCPNASPNGLSLEDKSGPPDDWRDGVHLRLRLPRHFVNAHGVANALDRDRKHFDARAGQRRVITQQMVVGRVADDDAAAAGNVFQPGGQVYLAAKHRVVVLVRFRSHEADGDQPGVDARAELQGTQRRPGRQAGGKPRAVFNLARGVFGQALVIQFMDGALRVNRGAHTGPRVFFVGRRRAPKRHHAVADVFIERAAVFFYRVGDDGEVKVHRVQGFAGEFIKTRFRRVEVQLPFTHKFRDTLLHFIR